MVIQSTIRNKVAIKVGDKVTLVRPPENEQHESPGFSPILDRHVGKPLVVRDVAHADGYDLVLVWETGLPLRGDWLRK